MNPSPLAIVIIPTRELAQQIYTVSIPLFHLFQVNVTLITSGLGTYDLRLKLLKGTHVVISTPGRFLDLLSKNVTSTQRTTLVVLDEADKMLELGFEPQLQEIFLKIRDDKVTWLFSATYSKKMEQ